METAGKFFSGTAYASQQASFDANDMITFAESYASSLLSVEKEKEDIWHQRKDQWKRELIKEHEQVLILEKKLKEKDSVKPGFEKVLYSMKDSIINSSYSEVLNERNSGRIASLDDAISEYLKHQPEEKEGWISVKDRLPEGRFVPCLVCNMDAPEYNQHVFIACWYDQKQDFGSYSTGDFMGTITHWKELINLPPQQTETKP